MRITIPAKKPLPVSSLLLFLLLSVCIFLIFLYSSSSSSAASLRSRTTTTTSSNGESEEKTSRRTDASCDYSRGRWVYDPQAEPLYDHTCKEIFRGWNCIANNKSNALELTKWRWQPYDCDLPRLDPFNFLDRFRNTNIGFVGDSLNRNMFVSLVCSLRRASNEVRKWRPAKADRGFTFLRYNLTIAYHRTNLLARYSRWSAGSSGGVLESLGYKDGFRVDVDIPDSSWSLAPSFHDILILNTGHWWWAPSKFDPQSSPMLFFEKGLPVIPPKHPEVGLDMTLKHMVCCTSFWRKKHLLCLN
ncbi:unnamed protein product [Victoria cruziana]